AINRLELPSFSLGNDTAVCFMENIELTVDASMVPDVDSVNWYSTNAGGVSIAGLLLADNQVFDYQVLADDQIIAEVFNTNNCVNYDTIAINRLALPSFSLGQDTAICFDENIVLSVSMSDVPNIDSVNWYSQNAGGVSASGLLIADNQIFDYEVFETDEIIAEVFNTSGCVNYDTILVQKTDLPDFNIGRDTAVCFNESILLQTAFDFDSVNWYSKSRDQLLLADSWFFNYTVLETDTIVAEVFNESRCVDYDTIIVQMNVLPSFSLGDNRGVCFADTARLDVGSGWNEVNWYTFGNRILAANQEQYEYKVEDDLTLWAEVYNDNRCVNYDTITIESFELPEFELEDDFAICFEDTISINTGITDADFIWTTSSGAVVSNENFYEEVAERSLNLFVVAEDENACFFRDSVEVTVNELPDFAIVGDSEICARDSVKLSVDFPFAETIIWSTNENTLLAGEASYEEVLFDTEEFFATIIDQNGCTNIDSVTVIVNQLPIPQIENDTLLCFGEELAIGGNYTNENSLTFDWMPATFLNDPEAANPVSTPTEPISYFLTLTDDKGCVSIDSIYIEVNPEILLNAGGEVEVCIGDTVQLGGDPTAKGSRFPYTYTWSPSESIINSQSANPLVFPEEDRWYNLMVSTGRCETIEDSVFVTVNDLPIVEISPQQSIGSGSSVELTASGGVEYLWSPEISLDNPETSNPIASPLVNTTYVVEVVDENGCLSTAEVTVLVQNKLFIPSLFTPNNDGNNDAFLIYGSGIKALTLAIYDKQGNPIYSTSDLGQILETGWDGTSGGDMMKNDSYIWTISGVYFDDTPVTYEGSTRGIIKLAR
ncbi:MAG: gliding motility-associated C-terminal domain-containing protein, partial [Cyclobacteriaceae bacterium]